MINVFFFFWACISDYLDGVIARSTGQSSVFGKFIDHTSDKILIGGVLFLLVAFHRLTGIWIVFALIIFTREILVAGLREFLGGLRVSLPVSQLAKWKTTLQLIALGALILAGALPQWPWVHSVGLAALWGAAILTCITGWDYLRVGLKHMD